MVKKAVRYFDQPDKKEPQEKLKDTKNEVIEYNIKKIKKKFWGRRQSDIQKFKPKKEIIKSEPSKNPSRSRKKLPVPKELLNKYSKGVTVKGQGIKTKVHRKKFAKKEKELKEAVETAARAEILLPEESGFLEADPGETTTQFTQKQLKESVDIAAATKSFELHLREFGPYRVKYSRNGRHLLLGGKLGHVAAFDAATKRLHCEMNVMETVHDVSWLHLETMFAVAQKNWVYIYDNQGIELHCIKRLNKVSRMDFLPYHFLLATASDEGFLSWLDVSIGKLISQFNTKLGRLSMFTQNPWNAVMCLGHAKGVVSMWSPNSRDPLAKMLCHKAPMSGLHVDPSGTYMSTASTNRELKIWDIRKLSGPLQEYKLITAANNLNFSQSKMLAVGMGNVVEVYRDCCTKAAKRPYLRHRFNNPIANFNFCPYEDVLGVGTAKGFTSLLIPGSGEPNFDTFEANPFQTKSQRKEWEVKSLLEKVQPELINLDPGAIAGVDVPTLQEKIEARNKLLYVKPPKVDYQPRNKAKGKGGSVKMAKNKKIVQENAKKEFIKNTKDLIPVPEPVKKKEPKKSFNALDRFLPKEKNK